jgi:DNA-binding transcriptional regulator YiaG
MLINSFDKIIMKDLIIDLVGSKNRKTVSDLKLKKSMQLSGQDLSKINYTLKVKQAKLTPIIG